MQPISKEIHALVLSKHILLSSVNITGVEEGIGTLLLIASLFLNSTLYLHNAVPVVARGDLKQGKEGHAKVLKCSVTTHTLTWVVCIAN